MIGKLILITNHKVRCGKCKLSAQHLGATADDAVTTLHEAGWEERDDLWFCLICKFRPGDRVLCGSGYEGVVVRFNPGYNSFFVLDDGAEEPGAWAWHELKRIPEPMEQKVIEEFLPHGFRKSYTEEEWADIEIQRAEMRKRLTAPG